MKKQTIWILTVLMAITFLGLLCIQIFYMRNIVQIRYEQFAQGVRQSLVATVMHLEQDETRHYLEDDVREIETSALEQQYSDRLPSLGGIKYSFTTKSGLEADLTIKGDSKEIAKIQKAPAGGLGSHYASAQEAYFNRYLYQKGLMDDVILNIISKSSNRPITERADSARVAAYLRAELDTLGLRMPFEFAVGNYAGTVLYKSPGFSTEVGRGDNVFVQTLFPNDLGGNKN